MVIGQGCSDQTLTEADIRAIVAEAFARQDVRGKKVLVLTPDATRSAPMDLMFRLFWQIIGPEVQCLDYLIALGTHQPLNEGQIHTLFGLTAHERASKYASVRIFNHAWDEPETFRRIGLLSADEIATLSGGRISVDVPVTVNKMLWDYDLLVICGPTFPHEVVGFSGGNKYFFPGISGPEVIHFSHWLGAVLTSRAIIGTRDTPVRRVIDRAASFIDRPKLCFSMVVAPSAGRPELAGLYAGSPEAAFSAAAALSAQQHITYVDAPFQRVLSVMPTMYDDLWTAAKGMYKAEPVIADGGEVIVYAPHIDEVSYTHGAILDRIGYHCRDYFLQQWDRFKDYPWGVLAHSTHLYGAGTYDRATGIERPRIRVTLATRIPEERCRRLNLGYLDPEALDLDQWRNREKEGILLIPHAGETLYRLRS